MKTQATTANRHMLLENKTRKRRYWRCSYVALC